MVFVSLPEIEDGFLDPGMMMTTPDLDTEEGSGDSYDEEYSAFFSGDEEPEIAPFNIDAILSDAIDKGASDVHLEAYQQVRYSISGDNLVQPQFQFPDSTMMLRSFQDIVSSVSEARFVEDLELDVSYVLRSTHHEGRRTRLNVYKSGGDVAMAFRIISDVFPTPKQLGITGDLLSWTDLPNGLVMLNGPTGTGKALSVDTMIATPHGDVSMGEVTPGMSVYDGNMNPTTVTWVSEVDEYPRLCRVTFSDGTRVCADENHRWLTTDFVPDVEAAQGFTNLCKHFGSLWADVETLEKIVPHAEKLCRAALWKGHEYPVAAVMSLAAGYAVSPVRYTFDLEGLCVPNVRGDVLRVVSVEPVSVPGLGARCISVESELETFVCAGHVVTHNSTTLASMLRRIQLERPQKIITLEKPVEFLYPFDGRALVVQREIGQDARSFSSALDSAMRQAPDIILVGEVRNEEEVDALLRASETGHLTLSTMHTKSAASTINRIKSLYSGSDQLRVLASLSDVARGFANQVLVKDKQGGRFAVREVLSVDEEVSDLIASGDVAGIRRYQIEHEKTMEHGLADAVLRGKCTLDEARRVSQYRGLFDSLIN